MQPKIWNSPRIHISTLASFPQILLLQFYFSFEENFCALFEGGSEVGNKESMFFGAAAIE